ncbi:hypothetical protein L6452_16830 [Arctium lappa]|uniref:Uncharacterized protein n=1 Tax=Arctium lappa TaxID=4217 RepID=A0ACB9C1S6_ARCLA|nr:hypothetical protein L6452_16830 [Arctium lappa]
MHVYSDLLYWNIILYHVLKDSCCNDGLEGGVIEFQTCISTRNPLSGFDSGPFKRIKKCPFTLVFLELSSVWGWLGLKGEIASGWKTGDVLEVLEAWKGTVGGVHAFFC